MDVREKLAELLDRFVYDEWYGNGDIAEKLISNGVTVQELDGCKYCKEYEDLPEHFIDGKYVGRVFDTCIQPNENGLWHLRFLMVQILVFDFALCVDGNYHSRRKE